MSRAEAIKEELRAAREEARHCAGRVLTLEIELERAISCDGVTMFGVDMSDGAATVLAVRTPVALSLARAPGNGRWMAMAELLYEQDRPSIHAFGAAPYAAARALEETALAFASLVGPAISERVLR